MWAMEYNLLLRKRSKTYNEGDIELGCVSDSEIISDIIDGHKFGSWTNPKWILRFCGWIG